MTDLEKHTDQINKIVHQYSTPDSVYRKQICVLRGRNKSISDALAKKLLDPTNSFSRECLQNIIITK